MWSRIIKDSQVLAQNSEDITLPMKVASALIENGIQLISPSNELPNHSKNTISFLSSFNCLSRISSWKEKLEKRTDGSMPTGVTIFYGYMTIQRRVRLFIIYVWAITNWKNGTSFQIIWIQPLSRKDSETGKNVKKLTSHKTSKYHRDYVKLLNDEETANDSAGELSNIRKRSKHQIIFLQVL